MRWSSPSQATRGCSSSGYCVRSVGHRRVAEHHECPRRCVLHEPDGRVEDQPERALRADQEAIKASVVLRQQVLEGVAGHLPSEPPELGAHGPEVLVDEVGELTDGSGTAG